MTKYLLSLYIILMHLRLHRFYIFNENLLCALNHSKHRETIISVVFDLYYLIILGT